MPKPDQKNEIYIGMALIGTTGLLIGLVMDSSLLMVIASFFRLGGRRFCRLARWIPVYGDYLRGRISWCLLWLPNW